MKKTSTMLKCFSITFSTLCAMLLFPAISNAQDLVLPPDVTIECGGSLDPGATGMATATDDCGSGVETIMPTFADDNSGLTGCSNTGVVVRTWTATSSCGSTSDDQLITIEDTTPPDIICPPNLLLTAGDPIPPADPASVLANDVCDPAGVVVSLIDETTAFDGCGTIIERTYEAVDPCGNTAQCTQSIQVDGGPGLSPLYVGDNTFEQGSPGGPYYYNTHIIEFEGGTPPYTITWDNSGYVRYAIVSLDPAGSQINLIYSDDATWSVTITDASGCGGGTGAGLVFTNIPAEDEILDIIDYDVTAATSSTALNGAIDITVAGGVPGYSYDWTSTVASFAGSSAEDLTGLQTGWYVVVVTDAAGQTTVGTYWVPQTGGGSTSGGFTRNKVALQQDGQFVDAYPNPFDGQTNIEIGTETDGRVTLEVFDLNGKRVASLFEGKVNAGQSYNITFDASELASGMYIVRLTNADGTTSHQKVMLSK